MRFQAIHLPAYGPFTGASLDLSEGRGRLEVIYGPNEAGKSSLLRAITDFLFGIPGQTPDNFLHPYGSLRIRAAIDRRGQSLECVRRKANTRSLRYIDDEEPVPDELFRSFVPIESRDLFQQMFGLDARRLRQGGEELLKGQSEFGQLLFSAAAGIEGLHHVVRDLSEEAEKIFKPTAKATVIAKILDQLKESKDRLREKQVSLAHWNELQQQHQDALSESSRIDAEIREKGSQAERCRRIQMSLGLLGRRASALERLGAVQDALILRDGFAADHQQAVSDSSLKTAEVRESTQRVAELSRQVDAIVLPEDLLSREQEMLELYQEAGAQRKAASDRPRLETELRQAESEMARLLRELGEPPGLDRVPGFVVPAADKRQVQELSARRTGLETEARNAHQSVAEERRTLESARQQIAELPAAKPVTSLFTAVQNAIAAGASQAKAHNLRKAAADEIQTINDDVSALPWPSTVEALANGALPSDQLVAEWISRLDKAEHAMELAQERLRAGQAEVSRLENALAMLQAGRSVPTLGQLSEDREHRDLGWKAVRRAWLESDTDSAEAREFLQHPADPLSLASGYEDSVAAADETADRLRMEADQVAKLEQARAAIDGARHEAAARESELENARATRRQLQDEWEQLWKPFQVPAGAPRQMAAWLQRRASILSRFRDVQDKHLQASQLLAEAEAAKCELQQCLLEIGEAGAPASDSLVGWRSLAEQVIETQGALTRQREKLADRIAQTGTALAAAEIRLSTASSALNDWTNKWGAVMAGLALSVGTEPSAAQEIIRVREELQAQAREAASRQTRIAGIDRDAKRFEAQLHRLLESVAPDLIASPALEAVRELHQRLAQAKQQRDLRDSKSRDLTREQKALEKADRELQVATNRLRALAVEAGCESPEDLPTLIERSATRKDLEAKLQELGEQLATVSGGRSVSELEAEARGVESDQIPGQIESIKRELEECNSRLQAALERRGTLSHELKQIENAPDACAAAADIEAHKAAALEAAEAYIRLQLARIVLQGAVDQYREKTQGDMLRRSSELFSLLTDGSFSGLKLDWDETGKVALVGVRSQGAERVSLEGMSDGTRDQLYLALRLASMELYARDHEPIPFIADDILVNFDDARATAAIRALAELATHTQVLLFTHHHHLVELARNKLHPSRLAISDIACQIGAPRMAGTR